MAADAGQRACLSEHGGGRWEGRQDWSLSGPVDRDE